MFLNIGPHHPATHGVLRLVLKLSGEQIVDVDPVLGYLHRGVEKICENSDYYHCIDQVDPLEYVSSLFQEWAAVSSFEKLMDVQVPRRAEYIRVLSGELLRVPATRSTRASSPSTWAASRRSSTASSSATRSWRCSPSLTGARMLFNYFRDRRRERRPQPRVHEPPRRLDEPRRPSRSRPTPALLNENEIFVRRTRGVGVLDRDDRPPLRGHGRKPARRRRPVRRPPRPPVQRLPRARLQHPDPRPRATRWRAT